MKISGFPSDPGPAAWDLLLPRPRPRATLNTDRTSDWVVIGAGFTGLSAARRLADLNPQDSVVVLEACAVAEGPAGRNSGFMIDLPHVLTSSDYSGEQRKDERDIRLNRAGIDYGLDAKAAYGLSDEAIVLSGKINGAVTDKGLRHNVDYATYLDRLNEPYERLDANQMREITGTSAYQNGVYTPGTAMIQPAMFIRGVADGLEAAGVCIHEQSPVVDLTAVGHDWKVSTAGGSITAPKVILAVNGHLQSFGFYSRQLMHIYTYGSMTEPLTNEQCKRLGGRATWALTPADPLGTTVRRISGVGGDRLIVRNRATFDANLHVPESRLNAIARTHDRSFSDRFPMLTDVKMQYRWGGRLCLSRNDVPVFAELEPGLIAACCQNGLGTAKGTIAGKLAAEFATGHHSSLLNDQMNHSAPTRLPVEPMASLGANAIIRWSEWRAGKEL